MKIKIITYTRTRNYGGVLQAYGLYNYLSSCGHDVSFIDYVPERCNVENEKIFAECAIGKSRFWGRSAMTKLVWRKLEYPRLRMAYQPFFAFLDDRCSFTRRYTSCEELMADPPEGDVYITGSDQVWNSGFTRDGKPDTPFYLPFANGRRISYASSFGNSSLDASNADEVLKLLSQYDAISVREKSGLDILKSLGLCGVATCDPTMLCDAEVWKAMAPVGRRSDYVFLYQVRFDRDTLDMAYQAACEMGKRLVVASLDPRDRRRVTRGEVLFPTIEEWLGLIKSADSVITDSFHATVFSLLFNKRFLVNYGNRQAMSSRITELLDRTGLCERGLSGGREAEIAQILNSAVDWDPVERAVEEYRLESRKWLLSALAG